MKSTIMLLGESLSKNSEALSNATRNRLRMILIVVAEFTSLINRKRYDKESDAMDTAKSPGSIGKE
jgi:hypothetical protein